MRTVILPRGVKVFWKNRMWSHADGPRTVEDGENIPRQFVDVADQAPEPEPEPEPEPTPAFSESFFPCPDCGEPLQSKRSYPAHSRWCPAKKKE